MLSLFVLPHSIMPHAHLLAAPDHNAHAAWLHLTHIPKLGAVGLSKLLAHFKTPLNICTASHDALSAHVGKRLADAILTHSSLESRENIVRWLERDTRHALLMSFEEHYPRLLREMPQPPALLYLLGNPETLNRPSLAIVGSRKATPQALIDAENFAHSLAQNGFAIVSGMAMGIDAHAHEGALNLPHSTIAVIGTGIDRVYPAKHRDLAHRIAEQGLIISEFPLGTAPKAQNFPRRNRIIAGLSLGCLVVEADIFSGSLITARLSNEFGREVFAIPGSIHNPMSRGCHKLLREGAHLVEHLEDILEQLGWGNAPNVQNEARAVNFELDDAAQTLLTILNAGACDIDQLIELSNLTPDEVSAQLLTLELNGDIAQLSGGRFQRLRKY